MRFRLIALSLLAASLTRAQKLAPEIARLARVRAQTLEALQHTRNYTCVETVHRFQSPRAEAWFRPVDVLRLEVGNIDGTERVSFLGDQTFDERPRAEVIASGLIVSGVFDSFARGAFVGRSASTRYIGEDAARDRPAFKYEYRVPLNNANS